MRASLWELNFPRQCKITWTIIRYRKKTAKALTIGDKMFTLNAMSSLIGRIDAILPSNKNKGLPGGCGTPSV